MKIKILVLCACIATASHAQTNFTFTNLSGVTRPDIEQVDNQKYPYLSVSIICRNQEKFADKDYVGRFTKLKYLLVESEVAKSATEKESAPLLFIEKNKGKFSQDVFVDRTIVSKVPVSIFSNQLPSVKLKPTVRYKNEAIALVKTLTTTLGPVLKNPASLYGPGAANLVFDFLNNVVVNLDAEKTINLSVQFSAYSLTEAKIKPRAYDVVIVNNSDFSTGDKTFVLKLDEGDRKLKLFVNGAVFKAHPYFIVEFGASNYFDCPGVPSNYFNSNGCDITVADLNKITSETQKASALLTANQLRAELAVLQLYTLRSSINEGVATPFNSNIPTDVERMTRAYDALYDYLDLDVAQIESTLYNEHYKPIIEGTGNGQGLRQCLVNRANNLGAFNLVSDVYQTLQTKPQAMTNNDLSVLHTYVDLTKKLPFLSQSKFNEKTYTSIFLAERSIYEAQFEVLITRINTATTPSTSLKQDYETLVGTKAKFNRCKFCLEESLKAETKYTELINRDLALRQEVQQTLIASTELLNSVTTEVSQDKNKIVSQDNLSGQISIQVNALQDLQKSMNSKMSTQSSFSPAQKTEIAAEVQRFKEIKEALGKLVSVGG